MANDYQLTPYQESPDDLNTRLVQKQREALISGATVEQATLGGKIPLFANNQDLLQGGGVPAINALGLGVVPTAPPATAQPTQEGFFSGLLGNPQQYLPSFSQGGTGSAIGDFLGGPDPFTMGQNLRTAGQAVGGAVQDVTDVVSGAASQFTQGLTGQELGVEAPKGPPVTAKDMQEVATVQRAQAAQQGAPDPFEDLKAATPKEEHPFLDTLNKQFDLVTVGLGLMASAGNGQSFGANLGQALIAGKNAIAAQAAQVEKAKDKALERKLTASQVLKNISEAQKNFKDATGISTKDIKVTAEERTQSKLLLGSLLPNLKDTATLDQVSLRVAQTIKAEKATTEADRLRIANALINGQAGGEDIVTSGLLGMGDPRFNPEAVASLNFGELLRMQELQQKANQ